MSAAIAFKQTILDYFFGGGTPTPVPSLLDFKILATSPGTLGSSPIAATVNGIPNNLTNFPAASLQSSPAIGLSIQKTHTIDIHMKNQSSYSSSSTGSFGVYDHGTGALLFFSIQAPSVTENLNAAASYIVLAGVAWFTESPNGMSAYLSKAVIDAYVGGQALPAAPGTLYISLLTRMPNPFITGDDSGIVEALPGRCAVANNAGNFPAATTANTGIGDSATTAIKTCAAALNFATNTGTDATVNGFGVYDAPAGGNLLFYGPTVPFIIPAGAAHTLPANKIKVYRT